MDILTLSGPPVPDAAYPYGDELVDFLDPPVSPDPLGVLKLSSLQTEDGYTPAVFPPFPFDQDGLDWMSSDCLLLTPEEQENDVSFIQPQFQAPYSSFSLPTPDTSSPSTPVSSYGQDPEVLDALSLISDSTDSQLGPSSHILPQFDSHSPLPSPCSSYNNSPAYSFPTQSTLLPSPLPLSGSPDDSYLSRCSDPPFPSSPSSPDLIDLTKTECIRDLLTHGNTEEVTLITSSEKKRRSDPDTPAASEPRGKRRKLNKAARKERKKEQNKQAAVRYRHRKRGEAEIIEDKRDELEALNSDLKRQVKALSVEISYLKNLWIEVAAVREQRSADSMK